jgi:hypothetical protein
VAGGIGVNFAPLAPEAVYLCLHGLLLILLAVSVIFSMGYDQEHFCRGRGRYSKWTIVGISAKWFSGINWR